MKFSSAVAFGFLMEIAIFNVDADGKPDFALARSALRVFERDELEIQRGGVPRFEHIRGELNLNRLSIARGSAETPDRGRAGFEAHEVRAIERRDKSSGID